MARLHEQARNKRRCTGAGHNLEQFTKSSEVDRIISADHDAVVIARRIGYHAGGYPCLQRSNEWILKSESESSVALAQTTVFVPAFRANLAFSSVCYQLVFSQLVTAELVGHDLKIVNKWGKTFDPAEVNSRG